MEGGNGAGGGKPRTAVANRHGCCACGMAAHHEIAMGQQTIPTGCERFANGGGDIEAVREKWDAFH